MTTDAVQSAGDLNAVTALRRIDQALADIPSGRSLIALYDYQDVLLDIRMLLSPLTDIAVETDPDPTKLAIGELVVMAEDKP